MKTKSGPSNNTGFWVRALATWVDLLIIYIALKVVFYVLYFSALYIYFPFQFSFIVVLLVYNTCAIASKGQTVGMWLLNIKVYDRTGKKLSIIKAIVREAILKILSFVVFALGFLWIGFSKSKKGWHDYLIGSKVIRNDQPQRSSWAWKSFAILSFVIIAGNYFGEISNVVYNAKKIEVTRGLIDLPFMHRKLSDVTEVSKIANDSLYVNWLNKNAQSPKDYAVAMAKEHAVTLFGESHDLKDNLDFFNSIINDLYYKAGVRCIAMEVMPAAMNNKIVKLVDGKDYNEKLAMEIARSQGWKTWGDKEYWDVLKTVWKLNKSLPENAKKMRLVGIDDDWEMANIVLLNIGGDKKGPTPFVEKFRVFPMVKDMFNGAFRDNIMAHNIEKETIEKGDKGVVWVGSAHTPQQYAWPQVVNHKIVALNMRMGLLLNQKYKDKIFQIQLFHPFDPENDNKNCPPVFQIFIEKIMAKRGNTPTGFSIKKSPYENLRDSCSGYFEFYPTIDYGDLAQGLIFLKPFKDLKHCTWTKGYISNEMFMKYKPLYEVMAKRKFSNAAEVDNYFREMTLKHN
ncbi:MAG: RDD family protein [Mucilaginibacter sp.]